MHTLIPEERTGEARTAALGRNAVSSYARLRPQFTREARYPGRVGVDVAQQLFECVLSSNSPRLQACACSTGGQLHTRPCAPIRWGESGSRSRGSIISVPASERGSGAVGGIYLNSSTVTSLGNVSNDFSRVTSVGSTSPLVLRGKSILKGGLQREGMSSVESGGSSGNGFSRTSSVSFAVGPDDVYPEQKRKLSVRNPDLPPPKQPRNLSTPRPTFLARGSSSGCSTASFSSEPSATTKTLSDEEIKAKLLMVVRARRKKGMGKGSNLRKSIHSSTAGWSKID